MEITFHPLVERWFLARHRTPTDIQQEAWPRIAGGENLLITAPTGSGKTLTAFLWAINQFATGQLACGTTRILYVSPLKALNNDIQQNLLVPLAELRELFAQAGTPFPSVRVQTRSGDTDSQDRRRMLRHPPEILITTPESLNILLSSKGGISMLTSLETVILDEIHSVIGNKRGVYLMSAVERLVRHSGEFQRLALSATVRPLEEVARFVAGYIREGDSEGSGYRARPISIIESHVHRNYDISVRYPPAAASRPDDQKIWDSLAGDFVERIRANRATLLFANSRALCEKLTYLINVAAGETLAYAHHGSLSREIRLDVEQRLKSGQLAAIVATGTLEMGIDIGYLDEVILVQSPDAISSAIQRIGRAGHGVGETSRCTVYPTHPLDFIEAAVLARAVTDRDLEPQKTVLCPLDVLAQIIVSMTGTSEWDIDELYLEVRRSTAYQRLGRNQFDLVLNMLAGRYARSHIRELRPRVSIDRINQKVVARPGALMSLFLSGGVIPDRGYFQLRLEADNARLGELDEEFVWEAQVGKVFSFGTGQWQIRRITHNDVVVAPARPGSIAPPFWRSEPLNRDFHYASRIGEFLEFADARSDDPDFPGILARDYHMQAEAAAALQDLFRRQRESTGTSLPHRHHLLIERISQGPGRAAGQQLVFHTHWGARINRPLAMALEAGWLERYAEMPEIHVSNEAIVLQLTDNIHGYDILALAPAPRIEALLRQRLEGSGFFGARFRENAGRALLLAKGRFNERKPLWMSRLQSQKLMEAVRKFEDFPLLLETWRTCLQDEFDLPGLQRVLDEIDRNEIRVTEVSTSSPSPFATTLAFDQINAYMYRDDTPRGNMASSLSNSLLQEVVFNPDLRPLLPRELVLAFEARRQRLETGFEPEDEAECLEWVKERTAIPRAEWPWDLPVPRVEEVGHLLVADEDVPAVVAFIAGSAEDPALLANWLQYYGPQTLEEMQARLGVADAVLQPLLTQLLAEEVIVQGGLIEGTAKVQYCDAENYEALLRLLRQQSRLQLEALPLGYLTPFLYRWQTRFESSSTLDRLAETLETLRCLPLPADLWETEILPARLAYDETDLDRLFQEGNLLWIGSQPRSVCFTFPADLDLIGAPRDNKPPLDTAPINTLLPDPTARYSFTGLMDQHNSSASKLGDLLWNNAFMGLISNDTMAALRKGIATRFRIPEGTDLTRSRTRQIRRGGFNQWRGSIPIAGNWFRLDYPPPDQTAVSDLETAKDRVRVLLDRYGFIFRELLQRESTLFQWRHLFRAIRLMELSGELLSGHFFAAIPGPQFASPGAVRMLQDQAPGDLVFWINAADPISPAGPGLSDGSEALPRRVPSAHLVYHGTDIVLLSERHGKVLRFNVPPEHDAISRYLDVLHHLSEQKSRVVIETINDLPATTSPYLAVLQTAFDITRDHRALYIQRNYQR
ncbi:MAG: DEAD/DEAH box helicase [Pseudomonadota bacterium]